MSEDLCRRVAKAVSDILNEAGYLPTDPTVGRILEALLDAHRIMVLRFVGGLDASVDKSNPQ